MTTVLEQKLKEAGVQLPPLKKRLWLWLKDHPGKTALELAKGLAADPHKVRHQLWELGLRKMVVVTHMKEGTKKRLIIRYQTHPRMSEYELLPMPGAVARGASSPTSASENGGQASTPAPVAAAPAPSTGNLTPGAVEFVESLSIKQAREIYQVLHAMFGKK